MIWPIIALIASFLLFALVNFVTNQLGNTNEPVTVIKSVANILLFLVGALAVIAGPISFIVGIILIATRSSSK